MAQQYSQYSPYFDTEVRSGRLGFMSNRPIPKDPTDKKFEINSIYEFRPDLLAYDLYGESRLWWVFAQRNPNTLIDPLGDFRTGVSIRLPQIENLRAALGF